MQDFDKIIWRDALTLIDFFATWCGPCRMMHPVIDKFKDEMNGRVDVYKIDVDDRRMHDVVKRYNIASVPTLILFRRGEVLWRRSGMMSHADLVAILEKIEKTEHAEQS
ncbi:MAG: thioredoxin [Alistipes sp.]|nr:thioredoxin [Alistipes sp.]